MRRLDVSLPPEPAYAPSQSREHVTTNANFDTNTVIILAALLGALICAMGINSIVRCTFRCCRRCLTLVGPPKEQTGLTKKELRKIPVEVYRKAGNEDMMITQCLICLSEFTVGEVHRVLPVCRHRFHIRCIDKWLGSHSTCPTCRRSVHLDQAT
jgi:E3 ubiquitin-protein ligase ATL10/75/76/77/78